MKLCKICGNTAHAKNLCKIHYSRIQRTGTHELVNKMGRGASIEDRLNFYSKKMDNGCIEWTGHRLPNGYGLMSVHVMGKRFSRYVHRVSYEQHIGAIPNGLFVCHKCDNRACINTEHLFLGSSMDNYEDMVKKGRDNRVGQIGSKNPKAKLNESIVKAIRSSSATNNSLAEYYGVHKTTIQNIRNGRTWANF